MATAAARSLSRRFSTATSHDWYLKEILNAFRVYDVATETALTPAPVRRVCARCNVYT